MNVLPKAQKEIRAYGFSIARYVSKSRTHINKFCLAWPCIGAAWPPRHCSRVGSHDIGLVPPAYVPGYLFVAKRGENRQRRRGGQRGQLLRAGHRRGTEEQLTPVSGCAKRTTPSDFRPLASPPLKAVVFGDSYVAASECAGRSAAALSRASASAASFRITLPSPASPPLAVGRRGVVRAPRREDFL